MNRHILVAFLKTIIFTDVMQIISSDHNSPLHLHFTYHTSQNTSSDRNISSEWAFFINISSINSLDIDENEIKYIKSTNIINKYKFTIKF